MFKLDKLQDDAINLLKDLISIQSFSFEEDKTATKINNWLKERGVKSDRKVNNIIAYNKHYDQTKPNILLNSHHDTVEPNSAYTLDPYKPQIVNGKLYGLGSNDAGGALVSLITTFLHFYDKEKFIEENDTRIAHFKGWSGSMSMKLGTKEDFESRTHTRGYEERLKEYV